MTRNEIDDKLNECKTYMSEKARDILTYSKHLATTTPDNMDFEVTVRKIIDLGNEIMRLKYEQRELEMEVPAEDKNSYTGYGDEDSSSSHGSSYGFNTKFW